MRADANVIHKDMTQKDAGVDQSTSRGGFTVLSPIHQNPSRTCRILHCELPQTHYVGGSLSGRTMVISETGVSMRSRGKRKARDPLGPRPRATQIPGRSRNTFPWMVWQCLAYREGRNPLGSPLLSSQGCVPIAVCLLFGWIGSKQRGDFRLCLFRLGVRRPIFLVFHQPHCQDSIWSWIYKMAHHLSGSSLIVETPGSRDHLEGSVSVPWPWLKSFIYSIASEPGFYQGFEGKKF